MAYPHISIGQDVAEATPVIRKIEIKDIRDGGLSRCPRLA